MSSTTTRRTQGRSTLRVQVSRHRQRSRSPDPTIIWSSTFSTEPGPGGLTPSPIPLQSSLSKRSKRRENQNPANSSSIYNSSRGNQNEMDTGTGPVARGDKSKAKPLNSKNRSTTHQSTEMHSSARTAVQGKRDRDRSLVRGESSRSSKPTTSAESNEAENDLQLTGSIAVAQYMRLQNEAEKLREVRSHHVMIGAIYFGFTHLHSNYNGQRRQLRSKVRLLMS